MGTIKDMTFKSLMKQLLRMLGIKEDEVKIMKVKLEGKVYDAILIAEETMKEKKEK